MYYKGIKSNTDISCSVATLIINVKLPYNSLDPKLYAIWNKKHISIYLFSFLFIILESAEEKILANFRKLNVKLTNMFRNLISYL